MVDLPAPGIPVKQTINFFKCDNSQNFLVYEVTGNHYKDTRKKIMMRAFVAVEVSNQSVIEKIIQIQSRFNIKAKPVEAQNLHFTLQFLGEISEDMKEKISENLDSIKFSSFYVNFQGLGAFPKPKFPRVVWIGTDKSGGDLLIELSKKVENVLQPLGFSSDKLFRPHITIFRIKNKTIDLSKELEKFKQFEFGVQEVNEIKLKQSVLTTSGPIYSDLKVVKAGL